MDTENMKHRKVVPTEEVKCPFEWADDYSCIHDPEGSTLPDKVVLHIDN